MYTTHLCLAFFVASTACVTDVSELIEKMGVQTVGLWEFLMRSENDYHFNMHLVVQFYYYKKNQDKPFQLYENNFSALRQSGFDVFKNSIFIIHGYTDHKERQLIVHLRKHIVDNVNANVIVVDWKRAAKQIYFTAVENSYYVGRQLGLFLRFLEIAGVDLGTVHLVGHSLGGQIAGVAGDMLNGNLGRITALDPAGPMFDYYGTKNRSLSLDRTDALFVDVVHTATGIFGVTSPIGHADFYPNRGGVPQPGCPNLLYSVSCSHVQSVYYFAESVNGTVPFMSKRCESFDGFAPFNCTHRAVTPMGFHLNNRTRGIFYLQTNAKSPLAMGGKFYKDTCPYGGLRHCK